MPDSPNPSSKEAGRWSRPARWWLAAGTFIVGLFVGAIVVGLLSGGSSNPIASSTPASTPSAAPGSSSSTSSAPGGTSPSTGTGAQISVNDACLQAVNEAQAALRAINDLGDAASQLNAARLDEIIQQLQPLQGRLRDGLSQCRVVTRLPNGSTSSAAPSLSPSASPTG